MMIKRNCYVNWFIARNKLHAWATTCVCFFSIVLVPQIALSVDMPPPPPPRPCVTVFCGTPVERALTEAGVTPNKNGGLNIDMDKFRKYYGAKPQYKNNGNGTLTSNNATKVNATDAYGAKAQGKVPSTTKIPVGAVAKGVGAAYAAQMAGEAAKYAESHGMGAKLNAGDYMGAAAIAGQAFANAVSGGLPDTVNKILDDAFSNKANKAAKKALAQPKYDPSKPNDARTRTFYVTYNGSIVFASYDMLALGSSGGNRPDFTYVIFRAGDSAVVGSFGYEEGTADIAEVHYVEGNSKKIFDSVPKPNINDFLPTEADIRDAFNKQLQDNTSALNKNTAALSELVDYLRQQGLLNASNTTTTADSPQVFETAPYTPAGSDQAQQTRFSVDTNGNVSASTISRPDLPPHSSLAPDRSPIGSSAPSKPTDSNSANSNNSTNLDKNEFCSLYPNAIACMPAGVDSYEDLSIPEQSVDLSFKPLTAFSADGTCPAPEQLNLLGNHYEVSYNYACETMRRIRPIVIACAMVVAMFIVYGALKGN